MSPIIKESRYNPDKPLPINRRAVTDSEFGYGTEPSVVPPGRCTIRQVLKLLSSYHSNPDTWDVKKEAVSYNLSEETLSKCS